MNLKNKKILFFIKTSMWSNILPIFISMFFQFFSFFFKKNAPHAPLRHPVFTFHDIATRLPKQRYGSS